MAAMIAPPPPQLPTSTTIRFVTTAGHHVVTLHALSSLAASPSAPLDHFALPPAIKSAAALKDSRGAGALHAVVLRHALLHCPTPAVSNTLLTAYTRCDDLPASLALFDATPAPLRDAVSYNSLISALCLFRRWEPALTALRAMLDEGHPVSSFTLVSVLLVCSHVAAPSPRAHAPGCVSISNNNIDE